MHAEVSFLVPEDFEFYVEPGTIKQVRLMPWYSELDNLLFFRETEPTTPRGWHKVKIVSYDSESITVEYKA